MGDGLLRRAPALAATLIVSTVVAGLLYNLAMSAPLPVDWSVGYLEVAGVVVATAFGIVAGAVSGRPIAVAAGACLGLLAAGAELETHTDIMIGVWLAVETAIANQSRWMSEWVLAIGAGACMGNWGRAKVSIEGAKRS